MAISQPSYVSLLNNFFDGDFSDLMRRDVRIMLGWDFMRFGGCSLLTVAYMRYKAKYLWTSSKHYNLMHFSYNYIDPTLHNGKRYEFIVNSPLQPTDISAVITNSEGRRQFEKGFRKAKADKEPRILEFGDRTQTRAITNLVFHQVQPQFVRDLPTLTTNEYHTTKIPHIIAIVRENTSKYDKARVLITRLDHLESMAALDFDPKHFQDEYPDEHFITYRLPKTLKLIWETWQIEKPGKEHKLRVMHVKVPIDRIFTPLHQHNELIKMKSDDSKCLIFNLEDLELFMKQNEGRYYSNVDSNINLQHLQIMNHEICSDGNLRHLLRYVIEDDSLLKNICAKSVKHPLGFFKIPLYINERGWSLRLHFYPGITHDINSFTEDYHSHRWDFASKIIFGNLSMETAISETATSSEANEDVYNQYIYHRRPEYNDHEFEKSGQVRIINRKFHKFHKGQIYALPSSVLHQVIKDEEEWPGCITMMLTPPGKSHICELIAHQKRNPKQDTKDPLTIDFLKSILEIALDRIETGSHAPISTPQNLVHKNVIPMKHL